MAWWWVSRSVAASVVHNTSILKRLNNVRGLELRRFELRFDLIINTLCRPSAQFLVNPKHITQLMGQPGARGRATKKVKMVSKNLPDLAMILLNRGAIDPRDAQIFKTEPLRIEHAEYVMIGDDE